MVRTIGQKVTNHFNSYGESYRSLRYYAYTPLLRFITDSKAAFNSKTLTSVMEIGCGGGVFLKKLSKDLPQLEMLVGIDISKALLKQFESLDYIEAILADASFLPIREGSFDLSVTVSLLHHVVDTTPELSRKKALTTLRELLRVSRSKGFVMINEEPVSRSRFISVATFWLTRLYSLMSSRAPIVNFLTPFDIQNLICDAIYSKRGLFVHSDCSIRRRRSGRYFLETLYYKIINFTYEIFFVLNKI